MPGRIIDIAGTPRYLSLKRGFICIADDTGELGRVAIEGVTGVVISSVGASVTSAVMTACADQHIPILFCNRSYEPQSVAQPVFTHSDQNRRLHLQAHTKTGLKNQLWKQIVKCKISNQAELLKQTGSPHLQRLKRLASHVTAGDKENAEAQAAQYYWPALFGASFRRSADEDGRNHLLNYGYAILRSTMLKSILANGLNPGFGIHHRNHKNPFCLADDLMEPYRPLVDQMVLRLTQAGHEQLDSNIKHKLARLAAPEIALYAPANGLLQHMSMMVWWLYQQLDGHKGAMPSFQFVSPLEMEQLFH